MASLLPPQRELFDIPREVSYLNCGYMSPLPRESVAVGQRAMARKARPWTIRPPDFFESTDQARAAFAQLLGASADDVALIPAVSYGMAVACANLPLGAGQQVLLLDEEFPSVIYPWRERARAAGAHAVLIPRPADDDWTGAVLERIDGRTAVAALPVCHWTDGALLDLPRIGTRLREVGACLAVDATQSLGALPFDLGRVRPDFLIAAAYKWLLGPYSVGFMYVAPRWQGGTPIEHNWITREGSEDFAALVQYRDGFQPGARRFDVGEPSNFALLPAATASLAQILSWNVDRIATTLAGTTAELARRAARFGFIAVDPDRRAPHYLGLRLPGGLPVGLGERLAAEQVYVSTRGTALRITPHVYNDAGDFDRFETALEGALRRG
ncbi:MAG TPA: aminotransferase class V-fold PLP-dependent enzyme [Gemmatimonadales bacterium]